MIRRTSVTIPRTASAQGFSVAYSEGRERKKSLTLHTYTVKKNPFALLGLSPWVPTT